MLVPFQPQKVGSYWIILRLTTQQFCRSYDIFGASSPVNYADASQAVPVFDPIGLWKSGSNGQSDKDAFDVLLATEERELQAALDDVFCGGPGDRPETQCLLLLVFIV